MPAEITFLDPEASNQPKTGDNEPFPVTLGPSWQPNDVRLFLLGYSNYHYYGNNIWGYYAPSPLPAADFTVGHDWLNSAGHQPELGQWRRLQDGDVDNRSVSWNQRYWQFFSACMITARGVDPNTAPQWIDPSSTTQLQSPSRVRVSSITVPSGGGVLLVIAYAGNGSGIWSPPTMASADTVNVPVTGSGLGVPAGWTPVVATERSGADWYQWETGTGMVVLGKYFATGTTTGNIDIPASYTSGAIVTGQVYVGAYAVFLKAAPDTVITAAAGGTITHTSTSGSFSTSAPVAVVAAPGAPIVHSSTNGHNPLYGYLHLPEMLLPGDPILSSLIEWDADVPAGASFDVITSINNGMSWDTATSGKPIPRLYAGNKRARKVLVKATQQRPSTSVSTPVLRTLRARVRTDSGVFEWIPIGHGAINKSKTEITAGISGGSGGSTGSAGVKSRGGGMVGNGPLLKLHAVDLSRYMKLAGWEQPHVVPVGSNVVDSAVGMALNRVPFLTRNRISAVSTTRTVQGGPLVFGLDQAQDPWQDFNEFLMSIAYQGFFRPDGSLRVQPIPDPRYLQPVWTFTVNKRMISKIVREFDDEMIKNRVVAEGESTGSKNPIVAYAEDNDPRSLTRIQRIGIRTERAKFPHINDPYQLQVAANGVLYQSLSLMDTVTITVPPVYVLEPGDCVRVECPQVKVGANFAIQSMATPLGVDAQELTLFRQMIAT